MESGISWSREFIEGRLLASTKPYFLELTLHADIAHLKPLCDRRGWDPKAGGAVLTYSYYILQHNDQLRVDSGCYGSEKGPCMAEENAHMKHLCSN